MSTKRNSIFTKKKKRPFDIFRKIKKPYLEEYFVKFPGQNIRKASKTRGERSTSQNSDLIYNLQKKYGLKYVGIHTHPDGSGIPSPKDIDVFIDSPEAASVVVPLDEETHQVLGYFIMKKNRGHNPYKVNKKALRDSLKSYGEAGRSWDLPKMSEKLKKMADDYDFSFKYILFGGRTLTDKASGFKSSRNILEAKLITSLIASFVVVFLFGSPKINGYLVSNVHPNIYNPLGVFGFIITIGIIAIITMRLNNQRKTFSLWC